MCCAVPLVPFQLCTHTHRDTLDLRAQAWQVTTASSINFWSVNLCHNHGIQVIVHALPSVSSATLPPPPLTQPPTPPAPPPLPLQLSSDATVTGLCTSASVQSPSRLDLQHIAKESAADSSMVGIALNKLKFSLQLTAQQDDTACPAGQFCISKLFWQTFGTGLPKIVCSSVFRRRVAERMGGEGCLCALD